MLQPDTFCEHTIQQNATAVGAPPRRPGPRWGSLQRSPDSLAGFKGPSSHRRGKEKGGEKEKERGREEGEGKVDSDAQLEQGRRLAMAGPAWGGSTLPVISHLTTV